MDKIGFGGGCHWCTEAFFLSLKGVQLAEQGWIAAEGIPYNTFSEAVIVHFDPAVIDLHTLIAVHLHTHSSVSSHSRRDKYRSAIYFFNEAQQQQSIEAIRRLQSSFHQPLITQVLPFHAFRPSEEAFRNYYYKNPAKPFCETHIQPKLLTLLQQFSQHADTGKIKGMAGQRNAE